ncbi:melanoma inhibitory activity protein 2 isoform X2 [Elgaria multicarinata webbii]|uniref:melanoma inhibitory activity protein 2 isoform X2 n=1 Tax=Elgaria multicarinata webbii TaxID=159646 RepID=UPI002FCD5AB1
MLEKLDIRILLLILSLLTNIKSTKMLSGQKKCGDPECETSMSRVLTIKDYIGPDCRYLNFKIGEEIMVYFKLSRKREDLWAGSKGTDFGYFPMDAVKTEDVFITKEVEVPTKETDFLCFDGGEYVFENEDSILNHHDKENEDMFLQRDEKDSEFKIPEDEVLKPTGISLPKEYKKPFLDNYEFDSKSKDLNNLEVTSYGDSETGDGKTVQGETIEQEDQISQSLKPAPAKPTWIISGIAGWFGLESKENEEAASKISQTTEEITFRRRKIAISDDSDFKKLNEEGEIETATSGWFQSTVTDLLHFGGEKSGLDLLYKEDYPEIHDSSITARNADRHGSTTLSETRKEGESDPEQPKSSWFDLELSDVLTFGYAKDNQIKEKFAGGEAADQNEEPSPPSAQSTLMDEGLRKQADESMLHEELEKYDKRTPKQIVKSTFHKEQHKENYDQETPGTVVEKTKEHTDLDAAVSSFSAEHVDEILKSSYAEQDSVSGNKVMENGNIKAITKESERTNGQSGWYESVYSSIIDFNRVSSDNQPGHESVAIQGSQETVVDQLLPSDSIGQGFDPTDIQTTREENQGSPQSFFSISYFTNVLNFQGFISKGNTNVQDTQKDVKSREETIQSKKGDEILHIDKESKEQLLLNQNVIEKVSENRYVDSSQENVLLSSLAAKSNEGSRETIKDSELAKDNTPHIPSVKSKLEQRHSYDQFIQITKYGKPKVSISEHLEIKGHSQIEDKNIVYILKTKQPAPLEPVDSIEQKDYTSEDIYSHEKPEPYDEKVGLNKIEQVKNSLLQSSEMYLERKSKVEMTERIEDEEDGNNLVTHKKVLKEHSDNFSQSRDNPGEDEIILDESDENNPVIQGTREQMLSEESQIMENNVVEEMGRKPDGKNSQVDFNKYSSTNTDIKANVFCNQREEEGGVSPHAQNADHFPFPSSYSQDIDLTSTWAMLAGDYGTHMEATNLGKADLKDATNSEEKPKTFENPQCLPPFSHYKYLLSFQSFADKSKNYFQRMNSKYENSQSKSSVELLLRNKEVGEKKQSQLKKDKEETVKEVFPDKDILLPSSAMQNNTEGENVIKDVQLLTNMYLASSEEYSPEHIIDSLFNNQKLKEKCTENKEEFTKTKDNKSFLWEQQHKAPDLKFNVQRSSQQYKTIKRDSRSSKQNGNIKKRLIAKVLDGSSHTSVTGYTDVMKRVHISDSLCCLQMPSEKHINNVIEEDDVINSYEENEIADVKSIKSISPDAIKYYFPINNEDELNKGVITKEDMKLFSQKRTKEQMHFSQHVSEPSQGKQGCDNQDTENDSNKQTKEKVANILKKQELSPVAASQEVFQSEKDFSGPTRHDSFTYDMQIKDSQDPQGEQNTEEEHHSKTSEEHFDKAQVSDSSLTAKFIYDDGLQEQTILSYPSSGTFSKKSTYSPQMLASLTCQKEDKQELRSEHEISSSQPEFSEGKDSNIINLGPEKKCRNQMVQGIKKHLKADLEIERSRNSVQHKQIDCILNTEDTKSEYQQTIVYGTPKSPELTSHERSEDSLEKTTYNSVLQNQHGVVENTPGENSTLHLEVQSNILDADHNVSPSKLFSHDIPHHLEAVDLHMDHIPPHTKDGLDTHHLAMDSNDETFAQDGITLLPKKLNYVGKIAYLGHASDSRERGPKGLESEKETEQKNMDGRKDTTGEGGVESNIFGETGFLGELLQTTKDKDNQNIIVNQIKIKRWEEVVVGSESEQDKSEVQSTKAIHYLDNIKMMEQESQGETYSHTEEKSITSDSRNYNQKDDTPVIHKAESVFHETVQNGKLITDTEFDLKETSGFRGFQEHYLKLVEEPRWILQANMCERHELQQLEHKFEKLHHDITTFSCEDIYKERKQAATSVEHANKLNIGREKCLTEKMNLLPELQGLMMDIRNMCEVQKAESGITNQRKLPDNAPKEKLPLNSDKELNSGQHSETNNMLPVNIEGEIRTPVKNGQHQLALKEKLTRNNLMTQNYTISDEREWLLQIILHLNDFCTLITSGFAAITSTTIKVVAALPENMRPGPDLYGFPWEMVICGAVIAIFTVLLLIYRSYQSIRSRLYVGREKQLASKVAELVEDKSKVLEKLSLCKKEYEELESSLKDNSFLQGSTTISDIKTAYEELSNSNSELKNEIECLEEELKEEKSKRSEQDDLMAEIQKKMESLENEAKSIQLQVAETKTTLKVYEINRQRLKTSVQDALEENSHLHESEKQLLQEAEGWDERFSELNEQRKLFESSKADMEEALKNKESQVKSLTECLLKMKDWNCALGENAASENNHWDNDVKSETENGEHLDDEEKRTVRKLIYAAKLNACLKSLETERNQIYSKLTDENKAKEELAERIESLQKEHLMLQSENTNFESEVQKLQQKLKVMTELYQENEMNLHRKLTVEEKERLQKEEKLSKVDEKINHAAEELNAYRQRAKDLEEELERTVRSYQNQIMSHEKKAHDNWLTARAAERQLNDKRKENLDSRQRLTEAEFKYDVLGKDPYALDVPVGAFGRGSRGLGNIGAYEVGNERGEMNSDRLSDPRRPPSDTGSLSPPWDRDHRIIPPYAGQLYNEQSLPPRRPERFYSNPPNSGRLSGPAELRSYNMHSFDKADGQASENNSRMDLSGNGMKDHPTDSNMPNMSDPSLAPESESFGPGIVPPPLPLFRAPLMPMDSRGPYVRRGPPFLPVPPSAVYGPREYFPRDFAGLPRPLLPMRAPLPMRPFSQYPPPRPGYFSPLPPDNRNELPAEPTHLSTVSSTDQELQQET